MKKHCISRRSFLKAAGTLGVAGTLAACGSASSASTSASSTAAASSSASSTASSAASTEHVDLTLWLPIYQFGDGISDADFWAGKLETFEAENNCTVNVEILSWTDYATVIYTGMLAGTGEGPDVVYVTEYYDLINAGLLAPLDDYITDEDREKYLFLEQGAYDSDGKLCTWPMMAGNPCVIFYNMDMLSAAGVTELPTTWDDFYDVCVALKAANPSVWPYIQSWGASNGVSACLASFWPFFFQAGGEVLDSEGNLNFDCDATLEVLNFIKKFKDDGIFDDSIVTMNDPNGKFVNGEAAIIINGTGNASTFTEKGINWQCSLGLEGSAGLATNFSVDSLSVASYCESKEVAAKLIKYITSAECMDDFHEQIYGMPSLTTDATYTEDEPFQSLYANDSDKMHVVPSFEGSASFLDQVQQNVQGMLMGQLTPEEVIEQTMTYYNEQIVS